jgi:hypothetical protein
MARDSFLVTPFVDLDAAEVSVSLFTNSSGEASVVLQLGGGVSVHVYDPALLGRLGEVAARGRDLLTAALTGQDVLPFTAEAVPA